jgi:hypothetical protein
VFDQLHNLTVPEEVVRRTTRSFAAEVPVPPPKLKTSMRRGGRRLRRLLQCIDDVLYLLRIETKHAHRGHDSTAGEFGGIGQKLY